MYLLQVLIGLVDCELIVNFVAGQTDYFDFGFAALN